MNLSDENLSTQAIDSQVSTANIDGQCVITPSSVESNPSSVSNNLHGSGRVELDRRSEDTSSTSQRPTPARPERSVFRRRAKWTSIPGPQEIEQERALRFRDFEKDLVNGRNDFASIDHKLIAGTSLSSLNTPEGSPVNRDSGANTADSSACNYQASPSYMHRIGELGIARNMTVPAFDWLRTSTPISSNPRSINDRILEGNNEHVQPRGSTTSLEEPAQSSLAVSVIGNSPTFTTPSAGDNSPSSGL